jgi:hypothetical protein
LPEPLVFQQQQPYHLTYCSNTAPEQTLKNNLQPAFIIFARAEGRMRVPPLKKLFISFIKPSDAAAARGRSFCFIYLHWWLHAQITAHFNALSVINLPYTLMRVQFARQRSTLAAFITDSGNTQCWQFV